MEVYIGNSPEWSLNPKCSGGPHLKSTYDDYFDDNEFAEKLVPAYGFEVWCNMSGQYTFFVAAGVPSEAVALCSIAVFGTCYIRDESLTDIIEIQTGNQSVLSVQHVHSEETIGNQLVIDLRQSAGADLPFVTFVNGATSTDVVIDTTDVEIGEYTLVLESFDTASNVYTTLKTDTITIVVTKAACGLSKEDFETITVELIELAAYRGVS